MFEHLFWKELGQVLNDLDHAGARGRDVLASPGCEWFVELLMESRFTRHLVFVCVEPPLRQLMPGFLDGTLGQSEQAVFVGHLLVCDRCREEIEAIRSAARLRKEVQGRRVP